MDVKNAAANSLARRALQGPVAPLQKQPSVRQARYAIVVGESILIGLRAQSVPQAKSELAGIDRLVQKVRRTELERLELGLGIRGGGQHDDRDVSQLLVATNPLEDFEAVHVRHVEIQQQYVSALRDEGFDCAPRVGDRDELCVPLALQERLENLDCGRLVVHEHDGRALEALELLVHHRHSVSPSATPQWAFRPATKGL